ncbi:N-acyl homoserine lactonase family protein [Schumannella luteola]|uniref:Glyoxylase-like metal-dependent hydrolase (Beta-lactamase superfamily II) n=1 Tax=Schumannella luteola TaxID=472059 RepID=A0A852YDX3_9MICO|nr:N-acyl homoserine lactonase family protein [Schumannella luteola]NYH00724.1 glyoxylase-like metal-dependent hydrolase (beta-lactamase superfamily II) [Schumannella luteola]TPX03939.1 N-acyl homoserine lactonase family protein [Schumannella luteola]
MPSEQKHLWQVTIVRYGTRHATREGVYLNYPLYGEPDGDLEMDYFFWVLRDGEREIVVDTGFSRLGGDNRQRTFLLEPHEAFALAEVDPATAPEVILTHGHFDHIGNIALFENARFLLARKEFDFWTGPNGHQTLFHHSVEDTEIAALVAARDAGRIDFFGGELDYAPGVRVIEVGGHTPGQAMVLVDTSEGTVLLASDAVHYYEEYERDMPFTSVAELPAMYDAFRLIRDALASGEVAHVVTGHDPSTLDRFPRAAGALGEHASVIGELPATSAAPAADIHPDQKGAADALR